MRRSVVSLTLALLFLSTTAAPHQAAFGKEFDLVVYGGTSAGIAAAIQATRMHKTAVVIEPSQHVGGLTTGGLGWTDSGSKAAIGGISREFYQRVKKHYDRPEVWRFVERQKYSRYRPQDDAMWTFEPKVAESIYRTMLREANVVVALGQRLDRQQGVTKRGNRIVSIAMESGERYTGKIFIDATYEGDLLATAGVTYTVGREANSQYGERLNGIQKRQNTHSHRFRVNVDPYVRPGDPSSGLVAGVHAEAPGKDGDGDKRLQAYCYRMCMSNVAENRVPFPKPEGYNEANYELLFRNFTAGDLRVPMKPDMMPNGKTDTNNNCAFSTDNIGKNYAYPEASYEQRAVILKEHETYQKGLMWTLANHPRVPLPIRQRMAIWGLAKDEFVDNGNWPHQIYVREARRMVSDYVMTEADCTRTRLAKDSVGLGSYNMDSHNCQRYVTPEGFVQNEGDVQVSPGGPYMISYRSLVPKRGEAANLFVTCCISSSHIAYGSIRMEPVFMILGQSAATAAVQAIENKQAVQDVDYVSLRERLLRDGQVLDLPPQAKPKIVLSAKQFRGVVIDDRDAKAVGTWSVSASVQPYLEFGYRHDGNADKGQKSLEFATKVKPGRYEVRLAYTANPNRATNVPVTIIHAEGRTTKLVNQQQTPTIAKVFVSLGTFKFSTANAQVVITNDATDGYVVVDGIQLIPAD